MSTGSEGPAVVQREREGRIVERRRVGDMKSGDLVQHYSTWEQTFGDAIRVEFVKWEHGPNLGDHKIVVTWHDPDGERDDYETRERPNDLVDVVVGVAKPKPSPSDALANVVKAARELDALFEMDGDGYHLDGEAVTSGAGHALLSLHDYLNDVTRAGA